MRLFQIEMEVFLLSLTWEGQGLSLWDKVQPYFQDCSQLVFGISAAEYSVNPVNLLGYIERLLLILFSYTCISEWVQLGSLRKKVSCNSKSFVSIKHLYDINNMTSTNYYVRWKRLTRLAKIAAYFFSGVFFINMCGPFTATNIYRKVKLSWKHWLMFPMLSHRLIVVY